MASLINVLHVYKTSSIESFGGVEIFIDTLCKATSKHGIKNIVFTLSKSPSVEPIHINGYTVYQAKQDMFIASTGFSISAFRKFKKLAHQADVVHYHFPNPFADILHFTCKISKPTLVTYHSDIVKQKNLLRLYQPLRHKFLQSVDHIVATSPNYFSSSDVLQNYTNKASVIPIGIDINSYPKISNKRFDYWQERFPYPFFLFIGVMRYYKGLHIALDAIKGKNIKLVIAGAGGIEKKIKEQAASLSLNNVDFVGGISNEDKAALLKLCYGFIFPSHLRSEAFGIALLEAAAFGKPLISCEIGTGTSFINSNTKTGFVVSPGSANDLRDAMQFMLKNPLITFEMGLSAKKRFEELFSIDKQVQLYCKLYKQLIIQQSRSKKF